MSTPLPWEFEDLRRELRYWLGIWDTPPNGATPGIAITELEGFAADNQQLFFAADYDKARTFHVNTWPGMPRYLAGLEA